MIISSNKHRIFVGLPLDDEARRGVSGVVRKLKRKRWKVRWEPEEKWHMTLGFLGEVERTEELKNERTKEQIQKIKPFILKFKGLGRYPEPQRIPRWGERVHGRMVKTIRLHPKGTITLPKIIWLGCKGDLKTLYELQKRVRESVGGEDKKFYPHITLGRIKPDCQQGERWEIAKEVEKGRNLDIIQEWAVDRVNIYESILKPEGSEYRIIKEYLLNY